MWQFGQQGEFLVRMGWVGRHYQNLIFHQDPFHTLLPLIVVSQYLPMRKLRRELQRTPISPLQCRLHLGKIVIHVTSRQLRCKSAEPRGNVIAEEDNLIVEGEDLEHMIGPEVEQHEPTIDLQQVQLSRLSSHGFDRAQTLKLFSIVHGCQMLTMIDSGASHCFISDHLADSLQLPVDSSANIVVVLCDGMRIRTYGVCKVVPFIISYHTFYITCYVYPLRSVDVILGVS